MATKKIVTLKAKLSVPRPADTILRERLGYVFAEIEKKRVVSVVASAGYGKTTLIAQACRHLNFNTVWYRLDRSDQDIFTFIQYLIAGIQRHYAGFGEETSGRINAAQGVKGEHRSILTVLLNEIEEHVTSDLLLVLDDYHLIQSSREISNALAFLLRNLSSKIHLVVISRTAPDINLSRMIAAREAFEIGEKDLIFDSTEVASLYREIFGIALSESNLVNLCRKTQGWVTGLVLFNYTLQRKNTGEIDLHLNQLRGAGKLFASYLEENIYHSLTQEITAFLIRTSILSRLDVDFCNEFLHIKNAARILRQLEKAHLFTFPFDEVKDSYYYHHLFKNFLQAKLKQELNRGQIASLHCLGAEIWEKHGEPIEAIEHYLSAEMYSKACRLLDKNGRRLIRDGRFNLFLSYYNRIPESIRAKAPWCVYMYGRALQLEGRIKEAIRIFEKAKKTFHVRDNSKGVNLCLHCMASAHFIIGNFDQSIDLFKLLLEHKTGMTRLAVDALGHLIFIFSRMGAMDVADRYYATAMDLLAAIDENDLHAWIYLNYGFRRLMAGDFSQAEDLGKKADGISKRLRIYYLVTMGYSLIALIHLHRGEFSEGLEIALKGIRTGEQKGYFETAQIWNWNTACCCATALGNYEQAMGYGEKCLQLSKDLNSIWSEAWAHRALAEAHLKSKNPAKAKTSARTAVQIISPLKLTFDKGIMVTGMAAVLLETGGTDEALPLLKIGLKALEHFDLYRYHTRLLFVRYSLQKGMKESALETLKKALQIGHKFSHDRWLIGERHWVFPLLVELYDQNEFNSYLKRIFFKFGCESFIRLKHFRDTHQQSLKKPAEDILKELKQLPPPGLHITCFGKFRLNRGNVKINEDQWPGEKPRLLFKYLCFHRRKGYIARDDLLEFLWPEENPAITSKRLHVALTKLRHTLEPELLRGMPSAYLMRKGDRYQLYLGTKGDLDIETFDLEITIAQRENDEERAFYHYLRAEMLYDGDLFAEEKYVRWCIEVRETYREKYLNVLEHIIAAYRDARNWSKSIEYANRYLTIDPYAEEVYQALMVFYKAMGGKSMIIKTYEQCKARIEKELDCLLSDDTTDLFKQLMSY